MNLASAASPVAVRRLRDAILRLLAMLPLLLTAGWLQAAEVRVGDVPVLPMLRGIDGKEINPAALRGKTVVISYFSTTCPFCMNEAPKLQKLHRENTDSLVVIGVNIDEKDPEQRAKVQQWMRKYKQTFPVTTEYSRVQPVLGKLKGLPVNYVLDPQGKVVRIDVGEIFDEDFDDIATAARRQR